MVTERQGIRGEAGGPGGLAEVRLGESQQETYQSRRRPMTLSSGGVVIQSLSCVRLFATPVERSTPGFRVHYHLPELAQTHVHQVGDT